MNRAISENCRASRCYNNVNRFTEWNDLDEFKGWKSQRSTKNRANTVKIMLQRMPANCKLHRIFCEVIFLVTITFYCNKPLFQVIVLIIRSTFVILDVSSKYTIYIIILIIMIMICVKNWIYQLVYHEYLKLLEIVKLETFVDKKRRKLLSTDRNYDQTMSTVMFVINLLFVKKFYYKCSVAIFI